MLYIRRSHTAPIESAETWRGERERDGDWIRKAKEKEGQIDKKEGWDWDCGRMRGNETNNVKNEWIKQSRRPAIMSPSPWDNQRDCQNAKTQWLDACFPQVSTMANQCRTSQTQRIYGHALLIAGRFLGPPGVPDAVTFDSHAPRRCCRVLNVLKSRCRWSW